MAIDLDALRTELLKGQNGGDITWRDIAGFLKLKQVEAQMAGGITSYTINGRTVTKASLAELQVAYDNAMKNASVEECGGIDSVPISFRAPRGRSLL
jgi:hypothetical protein